MARIRQVKPDFWTSEVVAEWSIGTRLTFIGLWNYVDDNGVGVLNERRISSALYPMDDPHEALMRVREALVTLSRGSQLALYEASGKRLMYVTSWDEHQKVQHPGKPRLPRPENCECEPLTCTDAGLTTPSREAHEGLMTSRARAGSGIRGQGSGDPAPTERAAPPPTTTPTPINSQVVVKEWVEATKANGVEATKALRGQVGKQAKELLEAGNDPDRVIAAAKVAGANGYATIDRELTRMAGAKASTGRGNNGGPATGSADFSTDPTPWQID